MEVLTIFPDAPQGHVDGFGASGCWWAQVLGSWPDEVLAGVLDLLFSSTHGIGLTQYRHTIGAGAGREIADPWRRSQTLEVAPQQYDWNRDQNAYRILRAVCERGVNDVVVFANSPPARMTRSGSASGGAMGGSNLPGSMVAAFASYLVDITKHLYEEGLPVKHLSPINEPQWDWQQGKGQEGCHYEPHECVQVARAVLLELERQRLEVELSVVDAGEWGTAHGYADVLMADALIAERLKHFAVHSYWSDLPAKEAFAAHMTKRYPQLELWMSEWTEMRSGRDTGMASALTLAKTVHDDLTTGSVTRWQYWLAVSKYDFCDGLVYVDEGPQRVTETKRLWALGNYSRFIVPRSVRVGVSLPSALQASAFVSPDRGQLTLVVINAGESDTECSLNVDDTFSAYERFETSAACSLARVQTNSINEPARLPPKSVSTLVFRRGAAP